MVLPAGLHYKAMVGRWSLLGARLWVKDRALASTDSRGEQGTKGKAAAKMAMEMTAGA